MKKLHVRSVFFVRDAVRSLEFYTNTLGFSLDWTHEEQGRPYVFQVSFLGMEIILNQTDVSIQDRPGHGRIFSGLDEDQAKALARHVQSKGIPTSVIHWGAPTIVMVDLDQNEFFFWLPEAERVKWEAGTAGVG
jgi:catechol 2,3-dioxygenase-like lactoylglutathione lyase family enzyme